MEDGAATRHLQTGTGTRSAAAPMRTQGLHSAFPSQMPETRLRHARGQAESKTLSSVVGRTRDSPRSCLAVCLAQSLGLRAGWTHSGVRPLVRTARVEERMSPLVGLTCSG